MIKLAYEALKINGLNKRAYLYFFFNVIINQL
jgi:hypothetical protein